MNEMGAYSALSSSLKEFSRMETISERIPGWS